MSNAVSGVVEAIFNEEEDHPGVFTLERCEQTEIIRYPRGHPELIKLLS